MSTSPPSFFRCLLHMYFRGWGYALLFCFFIGIFRIFCPTSGVLIMNYRVVESNQKPLETEIIRTSISSRFERYTNRLRYFFSHFIGMIRISHHV